MAPVCPNCRYDLAGLPSRGSVQCPECGIQVELTVPPACTKCRYDLAGLPPDAKLCPECGVPVANAELTRGSSRLSRSCWSLFWGLPPIVAAGSLALGALAPPGEQVSQLRGPLVALAIGWLAAFAALRAEAAATPRLIVRPLRMVGEAFSYSFQWTILTSIGIGLVWGVIVRLF